MNDNNLNSKKDNIFIKVKRHYLAGPLARKELLYSNLNNYELIKNIIKEASHNLRKKNISENSNIVMILNHPKFKEIYFDSKEQWDLLYKYNIIDECISNKSLKIDFIIYDNKNQNYEISKKTLMKYIILNFPIDLFFNSFINFIRKRKDISNEFEKYLINDLLSNNSNINKTKNNEEKNTQDNMDKNENKNIINIKDYLIDNNKFIDILKNKFETISKNQHNLNSFFKIKNIFHEGKEKDENLNLIKDNKSDFNTKTQLDLSKKVSVDYLLDEDDDSFINNNEVLKTVLNPPIQNSQKIIDSKNFFKKIEKNEYYLGIENYKDELIRESMDFLKNNNLYYNYKNY